MSKYKKAVLAFITANVIWGAGAPIFKLAFTTIHPFTLGVFRFIIPILILFFFIRKKLSLKAKDVPIILLAGFFAIPVNIGFFLVGINQTVSINAPIIGSSEPIFLLLGSVIFLQERLSRKMLLGNILGLTGILLIILEPLLHTNAGGSVLGNVLLIVSMLGSVIGAILSKKIIKKYDPLVMTFWTFVIGLIVFFPFAIKEINAYGFIAQIHSLPAIVGIIWGGLFASLVGYCCYFWGLKQMKASDTTVFSYIDPIAGILVAMPLVQEYPSAFFIFGAFLVCTGVFIAEDRIPYHSMHKLFT